MKKVDWTKYIGYILFVVTVLGWAFTAGSVSRDIQYLKEEVKDLKVETKEDIAEIKGILDKQQDLLMEQQKFNGSVISYFNEDVEEE